MNKEFIPKVGDFFNVKFQDDNIRSYSTDVFKVTSTDGNLIVCDKLTDNYSEKFTKHTFTPTDVDFYEVGHSVLLDLGITKERRIRERRRTTD